MIIRDETSRAESSLPAGPFTAHLRGGAVLHRRLRAAGCSRWRSLLDYTSSRCVIKANAQSTRPKRRVLSSDEKVRRRAEINERKKLLRKAGIYGDPNRARNAQTREIALLREQFEKLQLDLQSQRSQAAEKQKHGMQQCANSLAVTPPIPSMWQKLASRQRQRREEAEETNVRLKLALEQHGQCPE